MSRDLYAESLCWLRYIKRFPCVCTESGPPWHADVVGVSSDMLVEVEVKTSLSDLRREFETKQTKHYVYGQGGRGTPNFLYYCVPLDLEAKALEILQERCPQAGLLVHEGTEYLDGRNLRVARRPKRLHQLPPPPGTIMAIQARASSELCGLYLVREAFFRRLSRQAEVLAKSTEAAVDAMARYRVDEEHHEEDTDAGAVAGPAGPVSGPPRE